MRTPTPRRRASRLTTSERTSATVLRQRRELRAADDLLAGRRATTKRGAWIASSSSVRGKQLAFLEMGGNQRMQRRRVGGDRRAQHDLRLR